MPSGVQVASLFGVLDLDDKLTDGLTDAKKSLSSFGNTLDKKLKSVGSTMSDLGGSLTTLGAPFLGVAVAATMAWDAWGDAAAQTGAVLKSTGNQVNYTTYQLVDMATALQDTTAISKTTILETENMLLTFTNIGHDVFPRVTQAVLDLSVAMGQDTKNSAIQLGKALNDPINGITALTRVGVTFTEDQKRLIESLVAAGDMAGAQGVILAEIEREFGGSAEAAAGPIEHLQTAISDLAIGLGYALEPAVNSVIEAITPFIEGLTNLTSEDMFPEIVGGVLALGAALAIAGPILMAVGASLGAIGTVIAFLASPLGIVVAAVTALGIAFATNFGGIRDTVQPILDALNSGFITFQQSLESGLDPLQALGMALFSALGGETGLAAQNTILSIRTALMNVGEFITNTVIPALVSLYDWFITTGLPFIQTAVQTFMDTVWTPAITTLSMIWQILQPILQQVYDWFITTGWPFIQAAVQAFMDEIWNPAVTAISQIWTLISPALTSLYNWFVTDGLPLVQGAVDTFMSLTINPAVTVLQTLWDIVSPALSAFYDWFVTNGLPFIVSALEGFLNLILSVVEGIGNFVNGVSDLIGSITGANGAIVNTGNGDLAAFAANYNPGGGGGSSGFGHALGIPRVSQEGMYHLHPGEAVVPANEANNAGGMTFTGNITIVANNPKEFGQQLRRRYNARGN